MRSSLEEERRALLAQIEESRAVYRRMLSGTPADTVVHDAIPSNHNRTPADPYEGFPHSRTVRWVMDHPLAVAAAVSLLVWVGPRWWASRRRSESLKTLERSASRRKSDNKGQRQGFGDIPTEGTGRALLTAVALLMRNPATMRSISRTAGMAWQWFQKRRSHRSETH